MDFSKKGSAGSRCLAKLLILVLPISILSCQKKDTLHPEPFIGRKVRIAEAGKDFKIPASMFDFLTNKRKPELGKETLPQNDKLVSILYSPMVVYLIEKSRGVLVDRRVRVELPDGGGEIDLANYVSGEVGSFFVKFEWPAFEKGMSEQKAGYYSRTKKRRIGDNLVGVGCLKFLDLTKSIERQQDQDAGFTVNTTRSYHTTVLGGHFVFSWLQDGNRRMTRVSFVDSKNSNLFCDGSI